MPSDIFQVEIQPSNILTCWILFITLIACLGILCSCPLPLAFFLISVLCIHAYWVIKKDCLGLCQSSIVYCQSLSNQIWRIQNRAGQCFSAKLVYQFRSRYFVILSFKILPQGRTCTLVIAFDALSHKNYSLLLSRLWDQSVHSL